MLDGSGNANAYVRVLLPSFLDSFGDVKIRANINVADAIDSAKWGSVMYRVQNQDYPYYHACFRYDHTLANGVELAQRNASNAWSIYIKEDFNYWNNGEYGMCEIDVNETETVVSVNGLELTRYANTEYATGAIGFQTRGTKFHIDCVEIVLSANDEQYTSCDVSFAKPAIRADMGDTVDLTSCDVQFTVDSIYTSGKDITWKKDGNLITTFTPTASGVTLLTATSGGVTKNVYVVTRNLSDGEYVLYKNDFTEAPTDFRVVQATNATAYHDNNGNYVIDASNNTNAYGRVLLPSFLDEFGDMKLEARYMDVSPNTEKNWSSLMGRVQGADYPYMQMCVRYNAALTNGVEIAERTAANAWSVKTTATFADKTKDQYNTYSLVMQSNNTYGYIDNGTTTNKSLKAISYSQTPYVTGAIGLQAKGLKIVIDYVKVTLGETTAKEDVGVSCTVSNTKPAIGCNAGQKIYLSDCDVQFVYGSRAVDGQYIVWKKDGQVITEFSETSEGMHELTATHGDMTMKVYVIAKKSVEHEYQIYENGFDSAPADFRIIQQSSGGTISASNGQYILNASSSANTYTRILLPAHLDVFGEAVFEASVVFSNPVDDKKWASLMYRVQNSNYPYLQACVRYNTQVENGVELSQRTPANGWNVTQKGSTTAFTAGQTTLWSIDVAGKNSVHYINETAVLTETNTPYSTGAWGLQARGLTLSVDWLRLYTTSNHTNTSIYIVPGEYIDVRDPTTEINIAPSLITDVKTMEEYENIAINTPAIAIMQYDVIEGEGKIVFADGTVSPDDAIGALGGKIIPAFRINDNTDADSLAMFLRTRYIKDAYAVSANPAVVNRAYQNWKYVRGVVDYSSITSYDVEDIRFEALSNGARVLILEENTSKAVITRLQDSYSAVWLMVGEGKAASVNATNKGPYGIITPDRALTEKCYQDYYADNTIVRRVNVIGHRGIPSLAQENTLAGAKTAYANGATMVENDVYIVKDGVLMVMHDTTIDRTTNGSGNIADFTSTQLKEYVVDYKTDVPTEPIPSLEDYFKEIKGKTEQKLVIEVKNTDLSFAQTLANLINKYDIIDQVVVISFQEGCLTAIRQVLPGIAVGYLNNNLTYSEIDPMVTTMNVFEQIQIYNSVTNPKYQDWGTEVVKAMTYRGVNLWPYTINDQATFEKLMFDGIGGITTNYSQWSKDFIENIYENDSGRVMATTYGDTVSDITASAEFVLVEDTLGVSWSNGSLYVPEKQEGGKASYFFRYKAISPLGTAYYMVSEVKTVEVQPVYTFELISDSNLSHESGMLSNVKSLCTVADIKAQFKYPVGVLDANGNQITDNEIVGTGFKVHLMADSSQSALILVKGDIDADGNVNSTDCIAIKRVLCEQSNISGIYNLAADCDGNGYVSTIDYMMMCFHTNGTYDLFT